MKPPDKQSGSDDDRRHAQLGRIVRKGLERTYGQSPELPPAERLYRQATRSQEARQRASRAWPMFLGAFGGVCATAALLLAWFGPKAETGLDWVSESTLGKAASPSLVGHAEAPEVLRFSDGSVVTFRAGALGRISAAPPKSVRVELGEGRANFQVLPSKAAAWKVEAGPYALEAAGAEFEAAWSPRQEVLTIGLFSGRLVVRGPGAAGGRLLQAGDSLVGRVRDGQVRVGNRQALLADLSREEAIEGVGEALFAAGDATETLPPGGHNETSAVVSRVSGGLPDENGLCASSEPAGGATVPDPGPVSLVTCRHTDAGPTGKDVVARVSADPWIKPAAGGCLRYSEDARGNRIPDFSHAGYRGGGVSLPVVPARGEPLSPGIGGDDTGAIQAAIDAVAALPPDAQGYRGAVELGPGVFTLKGSLRIAKSGVVLRGQGTEGPSATVLRGVGNARTLIRIGGTGQRRPGRDQLPVSDVYVPVGARTFTLERLGSLKVGDDITVYRPKSQRWICAIGADVMPAQTDGKANPPWRATGAHTFERRITKIEGHRITVDVPLTNALEKEFTQAYVTQTEFSDRASEVGVENLAAWGDFVSTGRCPPVRGRFIRADALVNGWIRNVRSENLGGELASLGAGSKWMTVEDATYVVDDLDKCAGQTAFNLGGQQNLFLRLRSVGSHVAALITETEMEGPNAVVDFLAVGRNARVRVASRWSTGFLFDNVRIQDENGMPSGDIDLSRGRATFGWSAANSVVWNSDAEGLSVDSPPTANNWVMGGARGAKTLTGTGHFAASRTLLHPQSLYRAQLVERLGRSALNAVGRSALGTLPGPITGIGAEAAGSGIGVGLGNAGAGGAGAPGTTAPGGLR